MTTREKFLEVMDFKQVPDFPFTEFMGFWPETQDLWEDIIPKTENIFDHFGLFDIQKVPINFNFVPAFKREILEETDEWILVRDELNCLKKEFKNSSAMPHFLEFPIKSRDDFYQIKERMDPYSPERYPANWDELVKEYKNRDYPLELFIRGPFAFGRDFIEFNQYMMLFYDDKELIAEMYEFQVDFMMKLWEKALNEIEVDAVYIGEDMAYKNGPMVSKEFFEELIFPQYKKLTGYLKSYGVKNIFLDSDGNIEVILPLIVESGIDGILPLENAAGMDPLKIREQFPKLKMIGGLDKLKIAKGGETMEKEIQKAKMLCAQGGYLPSFDHSVPPILSYDEYCIYLKRLREEIII